MKKNAQEIIQEELYHTSSSFFLYPHTHTHTHTQIPPFRKVWLSEVFDYIVTIRVFAETGRWCVNLLL